MSRSQQKKKVYFKTYYKFFYIFLLFFLVIQSCTKMPHKFYGQLINSKAPDFVLNGYDKTYSLKDIEGDNNIVLLYFGYTHCPDVCPQTLSNLASLMKKVADPKRVKVVFISLDPKRDTPKILHEYVSFFDKSFIGLTADENYINALAKEYGVSYKIRKEGNTYYLDHTANIYLIYKGKLLLLYTPQNQNIDDMTKDINFILKNGYKT